MNHRQITWRWRLVLTMILVSGLALGSFITISWQVVKITSIKKFDAELVAVSLKGGWPFMQSINPDRNRPTTPPPDRQLEFDGYGFAFHDLVQNTSHTDPGWPGNLDPVELGMGIPELYRRQGKQFASSRLFEVPTRIPGDRVRSPDRRLRQPPRQQLPSLDQAVFVTIDDGEQDWRVMGFSDGRGVLILVGSLASLKEDLTNYQKAIFISLPVALLLIGLVAWYLAGKAVGPVRQLTDAAAAVTAEGLHNRLDKKGALPEFAKLIEVYNDMLDRLERSFEQSRRFSADAAHEMNTPLTILQGHLDLLIQSADLKAELQDQMATVIEEVHNLKEVVRKLLLLSLADSGKLPIEPTRFDLSEMICDILEDAILIDPDLQFEQSIMPEIFYTGDKDLIRQSIFNLISNAIKYNRPQGWVKVKLSRSEGSIDLEVINSGQMISEGCAQRLFERFYRGERARAVKAEGRGLGLALAREFVRAHGGSLQLIRNNEDDIAFRLQLPLV